MTCQRSQHRLRPRRWGGISPLPGGLTLRSQPRGMPAACAASTAALMIACFINEFAVAQSLPQAQQVVHYANCDASTTAPVLNVEDFACFINTFTQGCP
jgi:hypothetical protein